MQDVASAAATTDGAQPPEPGQGKPWARKDQIESRTLLSPMCVQLELCSQLRATDRVSDPVPAQHGHLHQTARVAIDTDRYMQPNSIHPS
jgi:hypothetical protein